jgi:hypothetical protein
MLLLERAESTRANHSRKQRKNTTAPSDMAGNRMIRSKSSMTFFHKRAWKIPELVVESNLEDLC